MGCWNCTNCDQKVDICGTSLCRLEQLPCQRVKECPLLMTIVSPVNHDILKGEQNA